MLSTPCLRFPIAKLSALPRWTLFVILALLALGIHSHADVAADVAALQKLRITKLCPLFIETPVVKDGAALAAIVPAAGEPWTSAATELQRAIAAKTGVTLPIVPADKITDADWSSRNLIVLGNLLVSPVYARLYNNYFVCADAAYTGAGGYELRSVHNPWGTGHNAIALGAQDQAGLAAAVTSFGELVGEHGRKGELVLPRLLELHLTAEARRAPLEPVLTEAMIAAQKKSIDEIAGKAGQDGSVASSAARFAMNFHRTGDDGWLQLFEHALRRHLEFYQRDEYVNQEGPRRYDRDQRDFWTYRLIVAWDLLEEHPGWTDAERLEITNHLQRLVFECNLKNNWDSPQAIARWMAFDGIPNNHQTAPGLSDLFGGWYFTRHYQVPLAETWLKIATTLFHSASRSAKSQEDAAQYEWIARRHILMYALASGDHTYIEQGHAAETGRAVLMSIDTLGHQPAWGDHEYLTAAAGMAEMLSLLEDVLHDGRYRWMAEKLGIDARGEAGDPHWTDVAPKQPDDTVGVSLSYLPKLHYAMLGSDSDGFRAANLPFEETFDKLALRSGLGHDDDYLMLDGYAGGYHGHLDGNAIIDFTSQGAHWLVAGEYIRRTPKYHCALTVQRDGITRTMPTNARLDAAVWFGDGALTRTTMPHYNGVSWTRSIVHVAGGYVAVVDEATAEESGNYNLRCCWRLLGEAQLKGDTVQLRQREKGFALRNLTGQTQELVYIKNSGETTYSRTAGLPIHQLYQFANQHLEAGQKVRFINVFAAASDRVPALDAALAGDNRARVTINGRTELVGTDGVKGAVETDAAVYRLTPNSAWLAGAKTFAFGGQSLLSKSAAVCARIDARGLALGKAQPTPVSGLKAAETIGESKAFAEALDLSGAMTALASVKPQPASSQTGSGKKLNSSARRWRFDDFHPESALLEVRHIEADPAPDNPRQPLECLIDGKFTGSADSCALPVGKPVSITLDLGREQQVSEVRVHAWEQYDQWKTKHMRLALSNDRFVHDIRDAGEIPVTHVGEGSGNIETLHALASLNQTARYLRITAEPLTSKAGVYLSEIEAFGFPPGEKPKLNALATADLNGDGQSDVIVGAGNGDLVAIDSNGKQLWKRNLGAAVISLTAGSLSPKSPPIVICGADDTTLHVYSGDGKELASVTPPEFRHVPSRVRNITLSDLDGDGTAEIVIGCDSWQYMAYKLVTMGGSTTLNLDWKSIFYAHEATVTHIADLDGTGRPEIVAGNNYYSLQILDNRGKVVGTFGNIGPEQTAVTSIALPQAGQRAVVLGFDDGDVMAFDAKCKRLWTANVGDRVTTLRADTVNGAPRLVAASEGSIVAAFNVSGQRLWNCNIGAPAKRLVREGDHYYIACAQGVLRLTLEGEVVDNLATPASALDLVSADGAIFALLSDGSVVSVHP